jgi:hypothetical protein
MFMNERMAGGVAAVLTAITKSRQEYKAERQ